MASAPESADRPPDIQVIAQFEMACRDDSTSFDQVATAYFGSRARNGEELEPERQSHLYYLGTLLESLSRRYGTVSQILWGESAEIGAVRTVDGYLDMTMSSTETPGEELIADAAKRCSALNVRASRELPSEELEAIQDLVWGEMTTIVALADRLADGRDAENLHRSIQEGLTEATRQLDEASLRSRTRRYLRGVILGTTALLPAFLGLIYLGLDALDLRRFDESVPLVAGFAGGVGAGISVLFRLTRGRFVAPEGPDFSIVVGGTTRPLVGAVFGLALYALAKSGIIPLDIPTNAADRTFFFAALGFVAGFSERFAEDSLNAAASSLGNVRPKGASDAKDPKSNEGSAPPPAA